MRERVSRYKTHAKIKTVPGFDENWAWTGDQGLILQALVLRSGNTPNDPNIVHATNLLNGVQQNLINKEGVLMSWTGKYPAGYEIDYSTGTGVFWRSALRVWELGKMHDPLNQYKTLLQNAAEAATKAYTGLDRVRANDLAVLVAAYVMLPQMKARSRLEAALESGQRRELKLNSGAATGRTSTTCPKMGPFHTNWPSGAKL